MSKFLSRHRLRRLTSDCDGMTKGLHVNADQRMLFVLEAYLWVCANAHLDPRGATQMDSWD